MKKFLIKSIFLLLVVALADKTIGFAINWLAIQSKDSDLAHHEYVTQGTNEDILVFGSSRALHHYNPAILSDSLKMSCYNCGQDGNGIIFFYGIWQQIKQRYSPKMIIYDVFPLYDIYQGEDNHRYLGLLKGDFQREGVADVFDAVDGKEKYKMLSSLYRWNSDFLQVVLGCFRSGGNYEGNGFMPLQGSLNPLKIKKKNTIKNDVIDPLKIEFLKRFIAETKGTRLVFVVSPSWYGISKEKFDPIRELCERENITLLEFSESPKYIHNDSLFKDGSHLNQKGADEFTRDLIQYIR